MGSAAKAVARVNGVDMAKVHRVHLAGVMAKLKMKPAEDDANDALVLRLTTHFRENAGEELAECDNCGGVSDVSADAPPFLKDACPYCGEGEADDVEPPKPTAKAAKPKAAAAKPRAAKPRGGDAASSEDDGGDGASSDAASSEGSAAIVPAPISSAAMLAGLTDEKDLDRAVQKIQRLKAAASEGMWQLGTEIRRVHEQQLWKQRNGDDGKPRWKAFDAFCNGELGMTPQNAYKLMDLSKHFSAVEVAKFGTKKLGLLLEAPKEEQQRIRQEIERGASRSEVEREVRRANRATPDKKRVDRTGKERVVGKGGRKPRAEHITVAKILGRVTVKLYAKAPGKDGKPKRATKLHDLPCGERELENGVVERFSVQATPTGDWTLVIETKRQD